MPPKGSNIHHISFHFFHSTVLLSVPDTTTLVQLKTHLLAALEPLRSSLTTELPTSVKDIQLYEPKVPAEGADPNVDAGTRSLEDDEKKSIRLMGWHRWEKVFVSFRKEDGTFEDPVYTLPSIDDGADEDEMEVPEVPPPSGKGKGRAE